MKFLKALIVVWIFVLLFGSSDLQEEYSADGVIGFELTKTNTDGTEEVIATVSDQFFIETNSEAVEELSGKVKDEMVSAGKGFIDFLMALLDGTDGRAQQSVM